MKILHYLSLLCLVFTSCMAKESLITSGTYSDANGDQKITVHGSRIHFQVAIEKGSNGRRLDREYEYSVLPDGRIQPRPLVSSDVILGVAKFDWHWDGKVITRTDPMTKEVIVFNARPEPK